MWLLLACAAPEDEAGSWDPRFVELHAWTEARMREWHVPGVAIAVVQDGKLRDVAGIGVRKWGRPEPVTPDTRFRVGSVSKMVAGALLAEEVAAGRIDLEAPASVLLGDLQLMPPGTTDDFTLMQLVGHSSGLQTLGLPYECDTDPDHLEETLTELAPEWALWTPPGELYNYANQGYSLLGLAIERSAGERYVDLAQRLFDRSGMTTATYDWIDAQFGNSAIGHTMDLATGEPTDYRRFSERACVASYPSGGLMASARDLGHLLEVLVNGGEGWVSPEAWEIMTLQGWKRTETSGYGFGLSTSSYQGFVGYNHHGTVGGWLAMVWAIPSEGLGIAVAVNTSHLTTDPGPPEPWAKPSQRIMRYALDLYLGLEPEEIERSWRPREEWDRFVGVWHSDYDLGDVVVGWVGDDLWYHDATQTVKLLPYSRDSFLTEVPDDDGTFDYGGVSFEEGESNEELTYLMTGFGVARRR